MSGKGNREEQWKQQADSRATVQIHGSEFERYERIGENG